MRVKATEKIIEDISHWSPEQVKSVKFVRQADPDSPRFAVYPKGTIFEGAQAEEILAARKGVEVKE
jgi:hypothetical protein